MTIGEFEIFIGNVVNWIGDYITRLLLTLFGQIPWDDVVIFDIIVLIVIFLWVIGFIIGVGMSPMAYVIISQGTSNVITWYLIMIFSLPYAILIYFKHEAIYNILGKKLPLKLLFFIFGKNKHEQ